jgi:hypothetical protein
VSEYVLGDFVVRLGTVVPGSGQRRGMLLEVEYRPLPTLASAAAVLGEMVELLLPRSLALAAPQLKRAEAALVHYGLVSERASPRHAIAQYLALLRAESML